MQLASSLPNSSRESLIRTHPSTGILFRASHLIEIKDVAFLASAELRASSG